MESSDGDVLSKSCQNNSFLHDFLFALMQKMMKLYGTILLAFFWVAEAVFVIDSL